MINQKTGRGVITLNGEAVGVSTGKIVGPQRLQNKCLTTGQKKKRKIK